MAQARARYLSELVIVRYLGCGGYSQVYLIRDPLSKVEYAVKVIDKRHILRHGVAHRIVAERNILSTISDDGVVKLYFTSQDADSLYLGLEFCRGGDLFDQIHQFKRLSVAVVKFYAAEIVLILKTLRSYGVIHRDLKPENILLTASGHLKLADFGSSMMLDERNAEERAALVGSCDYVAPEILRDRSAVLASDLWAFGCIVYHMLVGQPPFRGGSEYLTYQNILSGEFDIAQVSDDKHAKDLVTSLLVQDPNGRLGARCISELQSHPFFDGIVWESLRQAQSTSALGPSQKEVESLDLEADWEVSSMQKSFGQHIINYVDPSEPV